LFDYASTDQNLTILYGCPDVQDYNIPALRNRFNCSQGVPDGKFNAYYLEDESPPLGDELYKQLTTIATTIPRFRFSRVVLVLIFLTTIRQLKKQFMKVLRWNTAGIGDCLWGL
jgi:hypothetical protein